MHRGDIFGMEDIIANWRQILGPEELFDVECMPDKSELGERRFTVYSFMHCEALFFSYDDLKRMGIEFPRSVDFLIDKCEIQCY